MGRGTGYQTVSMVIANTMNPERQCALIFLQYCQKGALYFKTLPAMPSRSIPPSLRKGNKAKNQVLILYFELFGVIFLFFLAEVLRVLLSGFCPSPSGSRRIGGGTRDGERWEGGWRDKRARFLYNYSSHVPADLFTAQKKKGRGGIK